MCSSTRYNILLILCSLEAQTTVILDPFKVLFQPSCVLYLDYLNINKDIFYESFTLQHL